VKTEWKKEMVKNARQHCGLVQDWAKGEIKSTFSWFNMVIKENFLRSQQIEMENLPEEILEILEKVQKSPELQSILAEKLQLGANPYFIYVPNGEIK
jgi:hypothetical protein